jgi:MFS transporter, DHA3 family, macrolide efflux protein
MLPDADIQRKNWKLPFFTIWSGQAVSLLGSNIVQFALVWWLTQETKSAVVLTTATLAGFLPSVLFGPVAGALVDRWSRRAVMMVADAVTALAIVVLALLFWTGQVQIWHVYALMFLRSLSGSFHWPAMQASTSLMVPKEHLSRIQGLNQMLHGAMGIGAAPLGALLFSLLPLYGILTLDVVTALFAIVPLFFVAVPQPAPAALQPGEAPARASLLQDLRVGLVYVLGWPGLLLIMFMAAIINFLFTPALALLPLLVTEHFQGEAYHLATLEALSGIGMLLGGLALTAWGGFRKRILTSFSGLVLLGVAMIMLGLTPASGFWLAAGLFFVTGLTIPIINGPLMAVVQAVVAPELQGRVFTLLQSVASGMAPLGLIIAGPLAQYVGTQSWFLIGGIATLVMGVVAFTIPAMVNIEQGRHETPSPLVEQGEAPAPVPAHGD